MLARPGPSLVAVLSSAAFAVLALASPAAAQEASTAAQETSAREPFTQERFEALKAEGALTLVEVFATWCPTCARQQEILSAYREAHPDSPIHTLTVDFDEQKEWVKFFKVPRQSTLILFRGEKQIWFSVADTDQERIFEALNRAVAGT